MNEKRRNMTLEEAREIIDRQDQIILKAFGTRMEAAGQIARVKSQKGTPVYVPAREQEILSRIAEKAAELQPEGLPEYAVELYRKIMELSRQYQNTIRRFGLLGRKLSHSFSPEIHRMLGEYCEPYRYEIFEKEPEELESFLLHGEWTGLNVTIPYKQAVMAYCDEISPQAQRIGAVNTLVRREGKIFGYNTDYTGFRQTVEESGVQVQGAKCIVLGSGGASKAVVCVLEDLGASEVIVVSRDGKTGCDYSQLKEKHLDAKILVNATPVGMYPDNGRSAVYPGTFPQLEWVFDLIYNPLRTNLLCQARKSDIEGVNGLKMLVAQAKASAELFLSCKIEDRAVAQIEGKLAMEKENIVLIGMPGCGKSTIGQELADRTGREFIDIDQKIVERAGMAITSIFVEGGENAFRKLEMEACAELQQKTGAVIACGGGVITREENYYSLAENGRFVFLNRDIDVLPTDGRPVSQSTPLAHLYAQRLPLYRNWCDMEVQNNGKTIGEVTEEILRRCETGTAGEQQEGSC
ncbi:MAG: shikimate kinase [Firmicutes bacterium]|nr:chorismate mutase [Bacillota bacterium]MDD7601278.1 shikimate kinase [Bacillota bacterium]MDY5856458.1 shikimate kinase [Anaerovoracaceae bacterium]